MFKHIISFICFIFLASNSFAETLKCEKTINTLTIEDNTKLENRNLLCRAIIKAENFFEQYGFKNKKEQNFFIQVKEVPGYCNNLEKKDDAYHNCKDDWTNVAALFYESTNTIIIGDITSNYMKNRKFFELPFSLEMYESVVLHEFIHALAKQHYTYERDSQYHAQDEYLAYIAQLDTMTSELRNKVLDVYQNDTLEADRDDAINDMLHMSAPHRFGVMCYKHFISNKGGKYMINRIFSGNFRPPNI